MTSATSEQQRIQEAQEMRSAVQRSICVSLPSRQFTGSGIDAVLNRYARCAWRVSAIGLTRVAAAKALSPSAAPLRDPNLPAQEERKNQLRARPLRPRTRRGSGPETLANA